MSEVVKYQILLLEDPVAHAVAERAECPGPTSAAGQSSGDKTWTITSIEFLGC